MTSFSATWNKPARERHAHVGDVLRKLLGRAPKAAIELCLYLFEYCIDGKFEEIELYELPLGEERDTEIRGGKRYARNTLREALNHLVRLGLVVIKKNYGRGVFSLTVSHPGEKRPFNPSINNLIPRSEFRPPDLKTDKIQPETRIPSFSITEDLINKADSRPSAIDPCCLPPPPPPPVDTVALAPQCQGLASLGLRQTLDTEPPPALSKNNHEGEGEGMSFIPSEDILKCDGIDPEAFDEEEPKRISNPEERQILSAVRDVMPMNPQLKAEVIKYTLAQVHATISLYHERKKTSPVKNPPGWIIEALRNGWATSKTSPNATKASTTDFPVELVHWYEWACRTGIVDGRELRHCAYSSSGSPARAINPRVDDLLVAVTVPDTERRPFDPPYRLIPWQEAITRFPMPQEG